MVKYIYPSGTSHRKIEHYDTLILGAGPAGLAAALYAGRYNLKTAVIAKSIGGATISAGAIENWPGFFGTGKKLMEIFKMHSEKFGARFLEAEVTGVRKDSNGFVLLVGEKEIHGKTLILALGLSRRKLDIEGEKKFLGKGVSYCTTCDGIFFKKKIVAVIGGSDSAAKSALYLSELAEKVYLIHRGNELRCEPVYLKQMKEAGNIKLILNSEIKKIHGISHVSGIIIENQKGKKTNLNVDGVFIEVGALPAGKIAKELRVSMNRKGSIITNKNAETNLPGVFAAGDTTDNPLKQVVTAAAEGAIAAKSAYDFLRMKKASHQ